MEVTRLINGISDYMGAANTVPDRQVSDVDSIRQAVGDPDEILGPIPTREDMLRETEKFKESLEEDIEESDAIVEANHLPEV